MAMPRSLHLLSAALLGASCLATPCIAAEAGQSALQPIRQNPSFRGAVQNILQKYESGLRTRCASVQPDWDKAKARVYPPLDVDGAGMVVNATWVETVPGTACGQHRMYNTLNLIRDGQASAVPLFPGESNASPTLQHDSLVHVASAVAIEGVASTCPIDILETQLVDAAPASEGAPWNERWRVDACGKQFLVTLHYIPDATGTTINVNPKETVAVTSAAPAGAK